MASYEVIWGQGRTGERIGVIMMQTPWTRFNPILSLGAETKLGFLVSDTLIRKTFLNSDWSKLKTDKRNSPPIILYLIKHMK